jgi:hypothetical protein
MPFGLGVCPAFCVPRLVPLFSSSRLLGGLVIGTRKTATHAFSGSLRGVAEGEGSVWGQGTGGAGGFGRCYGNQLLWRAVE